MEAARGNIEHVHAGGTQQNQHAAQILGPRGDGRAVVDFLELREAIRNDEARTDGCANRGDYLRRITCALGERAAAVPILATVGLRPEKLVQKITVRRMHLHTIGAERLRMLGGSDVSQLQLLEILPRHREAIRTAALNQA